MFETPQMPNLENEQDERREPFSESLREKINDFSKRLNIPDKIKLTIMAAVSGALLQQGVANAQENFPSSTKENITKETKVSEKMQAEVDRVREMIQKGEEKFFDSIPEKIGVEPEQLSKESSYESNVEDKYGNPEFKNSQEKIAEEGSDLYMASYNGFGVISKTADDLNNMWDQYSEKYKTYKINGVEIKPASETLSFSADGQTETAAILEALEHAANSKNGVNIEVNEANSDTKSGTDSSSMYTKYIGTSYNACIKRYEVTNIEKDEHGIKVTLDVVFGEISK